MERLEKLINILKLTPHRQPELVKEASHRILARSIKTDPHSSYFLKPLIEILIQYCDNDDSAQRSLFNDYLNSVILTFQYKNYQLILQVLLDEVTANGTARRVTVALQRIPHLLNNVQPAELGCDPQKLLKALIEVSRRTEDESILNALDLTLQSVMPYLDYQVRKSKESQLLIHSLVEVLLRNLQNESSQTRRLAAASLSKICSNSEVTLNNTLAKLKAQLDSFSIENPSTNKFVGFCLCVKEIPELADQHHIEILNMIVTQIQSFSGDPTLSTAALESMRELFKFQIDPETADKVARLLTEKFLKEDSKVILQSNALACISALIKQRPIILDQSDTILFYLQHSDIAVRSQIISIIGNYIYASWKFPYCVERSTSCEKIRKLWVELRTILNDETSHPDTMKSCVNAIKTCINTLLESDHCLHIIEYSDFSRLIQLYLQSNFKPFKIEVLNLFSSLNYRTLSYLEKCHWLKMRSHTAGAFNESLQERILSDVLIDSLVDDHQRIRMAATQALINIVPNLYITNPNNGQKNVFFRSPDPIVSLSQDLSSEHLVVLRQADEHVNHLNGFEPKPGSEFHENLCIRNDHKFLSSSIIQSYDNPYNEQAQSQLDITKSQHRVNVTINLMHIVSLLKSSFENSIVKGKAAISNLVYTLNELSLVYPVCQYCMAWDCRPSEYCESFTMLNFLLTYLENLNEPDVVVEDLEAYRNFLALSQQLLYALCHESVLSEYESQKMKPYHKRLASTRDGYWSELTLKHPCIADVLDVYFIHLTKLLWLMSYIIEERNNPFNMNSKQTTPQQKTMIQDTLVGHGTLTSNRLLFGRVYKKLESSFKSSKKNLNQNQEKFYQILETCLASIASLLEFIPMNKSLEHVKDMLSYLRITSSTCSLSSLICARQLLKSLFGINILALYQVDPNDWFEEESWPPPSPSLMSKQDNPSAPLQGVYHHLMASPYRVFSSYYSLTCSQITPTSDQALAILNFESRRALKVRRRIEERVKTLFEYNPNQLTPSKVRQVADLLKNTIIEFTPIVMESMAQFKSRGFVEYQSEILHFMSYLVLVRVNYQKLALAEDLITSIYQLLDQCGEKVFSNRELGIEKFLRSSFTFLSLLSYERGPSKPVFQVATVIKKLDDLRAKLSMTSDDERDVATYIIPPLRCLVEDLFIYRTKHFQGIFDKTEQSELDLKKDVYEILEAERETVAQKLLDVIDNPIVYDLLSILILESRQNTSDIKYKKLSQHLLSIIPEMLSKGNVNLMDYRCIELTRRIIENISPEVFQPVNFIFQTLIEVPKPPKGNDPESRQEFLRWMSLVIIALHILITQVKEEVFLNRLRPSMSDEAFVEYLLHISQLCIGEILFQLHSATLSLNDPNIVFLVQQLSSYILYLTHMFQSGLFFQLARSATELIKREVRAPCQESRSLYELCDWARDPMGRFSLDACEEMFYYAKLIYPDLTIFWSNVMMLLNNVDCNRDYWRGLLLYECIHCRALDENISKSVETLSLESCVEESITESRFKRGPAKVSRPASLNLSEINFNDQLRRSFIKKIAATEARDKAFNRNIVETSGDDGQLLEQELNNGNTEQCLAPNIELTRRGALCLVLDFVTISMNDVEHITWLIIHHINDIIRWSHETPITEFINAVHGKSASSGIFIQAINSGFNNLTSISLVTRLLWTLEQVHYTQYGSLVVLLVEKLLSSKELLPYRSLTKRIEDFTCNTVQKLLNETNKSLVTTNDEVVNQLATEDLDRIYCALDVDLYPSLSKLLLDLRKTTSENSETPTIEIQPPLDDYEEDSEIDEIEDLYSKASLVQWLCNQNSTANISSLIAAVNTIKKHLSSPKVIERINKDKVLVSTLVSAVYSLALSIIPPPKRLSKPKFWRTFEDPTPVQSADGDRSFFTNTVCFKTAQSSTPTFTSPSSGKTCAQNESSFETNSKKRSEWTEDELVEAVRSACLKGHFLVENIDYLRVTQFEFMEEIIIRLARLPLLNSFILTPPSLWRQNIWPTQFSDDDIYKVNFPMVTHDLLSKDLSVLETFSDRLLKLGWISRRQFEEAWMALLGVLSSSLSQQDEAKGLSAFGGQDVEGKLNLISSCKTVAAITRLLLLARKLVMGDPLSPDSFSSLSFEERVVGLTKAIGRNLSSLRTRTKSIFESLEVERKSKISSNSVNNPSSTGFSYHLAISAQNLRMNSILNVEVDMQSVVVIDGEQDKSDEVDVESCIRLLLSIYKQKFKDPNDSLYSPAPSHEDNSSQQQTQLQLQQQQQQQERKASLKSRPSNQLAPPLSTAICQSILALSDMFADYEQYDWLFETFVQMFKLAEKNEDEIQMQYLIIGLCKSAAVCCYEIPNELTTTTTINHRDIMFEKCRQSLEKCIKSDFGPLKMSALFGAYYMLEDSINIVASGAWELDHFKQLRQSRLTWIIKLMPLILDKENSKILSKRPQIMKLLECLCEVVAESRLFEQSKNDLKL